MRNKTLFTLDEPITPSPERKEPVLWIRRLVILSEMGTAKVPLRDISFRQGMNIIQTRRRPADEESVVGHSVGKTLLLRLIRYTLGEQHFAIQRVHSRIAERFRDGRVIAQWRVKTVDWIVVRPLRESSSAKSFAVKTDDWRAAIDDETSQRAFGEFLAEVQQAAFADLEYFELPGEHRSPKWLDVLGWLARDFECGYRAANDWRHKEANSGHSLDRDDYSLILQWMAGLMGSEEISLKRNHQGLLEDRQKAKTKRENSQKTIDVTGPALLSKLKLSEGDELFTRHVVEVADAQIESLMKLKNERCDQLTLVTLEASEETTRRELTDAEADFLAVEMQIAFVEKRIQQNREANSSIAYLKVSPYEHCGYGGCPLRLANRPPPASDPAQNDNLDLLLRELAEWKDVLPDKMAFRDTRRATHADAARRTLAERNRLAIEGSGIDQNIGRWQSHRSDAESFHQARQELDESMQTIESLDATIDRSNQTQGAVRETLERQIVRLSACYVRILKDVFGREAGGKITIDGKGLHPLPDSRLASNGAALSIMTTVLAFDISSVLASIAGIGNHPRLLLHDSPREGDMEEPLFHRLFQVVRDLELLFTGQEPSFQYIVTTTTPPPAQFADENGPFVRLTLDARNEADHLLRASF